MPATSDKCQLFNLQRAGLVFGADFLDADRCAAFIVDGLHGDAARCPECRTDLDGERRARFRSFGRVRCTCGKWFSATTGTPLHKAKIDRRQLVLIAYLLSLGVDPARIATAAGVDPETVRIWRLKFQALGGGNGNV